MTCSNCDQPAFTRGLCRKCYDRQRNAGVLEMKGTTKKGGRPKGKVKSTPLDVDWDLVPERSEKEIQALAFKRAYQILSSPDANQQEILALIKIAAGFDVDSGDEELREGLAKVIGMSRGDA